MLCSRALKPQWLGYAGPKETLIKSANRHPGDDAVALSVNQLTERDDNDDEPNDTGCGEWS